MHQQALSCAPNSCLLCGTWIQWITCNGVCAPLTITDRYQILSQSSVETRPVWVSLEFDMICILRPLILFSAWNRIPFWRWTGETAWLQWKWNCWSMSPKLPSIGYEAAAILSVAAPPITSRMQKGPVRSQTRGDHVSHIIDSICSVGLQQSCRL